MAGWNGGCPTSLRCRSASGSRRPGRRIGRDACAAHHRGDKGKEGYHVMSESLMSVDRIHQAILILRDQKVILDRDLAVLYGVPTKALKQAVKRNIARFPQDFMFVLTLEELTEWRSQFVTSKADPTHRWRSPSRAWRCFRAPCLASVPSRSISKSCGPLSNSAGLLRRIGILRAGSTA